MNKEINLTTLTVADAKDIAILHFKAFKGFFLTSLGVNFLKIFYQGVLKHQQSVAVGAYTQDRELIGFAIGTKQPLGFYGAVLKKNWVKLGFSALPNLLTDPSKIKRLLTSLTTKANADFQHTPTLLSICVSNSQQAKGIGGIVLGAFEAELKKNKLDTLVLATDALNNEHANRFYCNNNYIFVKSFLQGNREMNLYSKTLPL
ncbi:GNAT family N-acetyltransferase [Pedobacter insulae]|uniref:Ribosomal protein S18 acetylase RimI n=1 Tax=Pedobacter insulae TaxID=414048 RepID=A0A1I2TIM0_9SPHI|nr:GNAT family N-acetyltransferase [Pedobacter insulae]SFG62191.1 Ribosomal protein S18 acetylase RimI [Pedobacter insulae]